MISLSTSKHVPKIDRLLLTELPPDDSTPDSGSDEEVEFAKTEGDDDRRKTLVDSIQTGDSSLDQQREQSKLDDYAGFFHLPSGRDEDEPAALRDQQQVADTGGSSTTSHEIIDLSLSTDEEGEDDRSATASSGPGGGCDVQTVASTSVTGKPGHSSDGTWSCPICTLYAHASPLASSPPILLHPHPHPLVPIPHWYAPTDRQSFLFPQGEPTYAPQLRCLWWHATHRSIILAIMAWKNHGR